MRAAWGAAFAGAVFLAAASGAAAYSMDEVIGIYQRDIKQDSPVRLAERMRSVVAQVTGMEVRKDIRITVKERGQARQELLQRFLEELHSPLNDEKAMAGYDHFLKRMGIVKPEDTLKDLVWDGFYVHVAGNYDPHTKELVVVNGAGSNEMLETLFHELVHAAQDSVVDLAALRKKHGVTEDSAAAYRSAVEGEAVVAEAVLRIMQNVGKNDPNELLKKYMEVYKKKLEEEPVSNPMYALELFPYRQGAVFAAAHLTAEADFRSLFGRIPVSTEQVLHPAKFERNELPVRTGLEMKEDALAEGWQKMFATTFGEFFIRSLFNASFDKELPANAQAAEGWGGDRMAVYQNGQGKVFIWETVWDSPKDAEEFLARFARLSEKRFGGKSAVGEGWQGVYGTNQRLFVKRSGTRVLAMEGTVGEEAARGVAQTLGM